MPCALILRCSLDGLVPRQDLEKRMESTGRLCAPRDFQDLFRDSASLLS